MLTIIAAPTTQDFANPRLSENYSQPQFLTQSEQLVQICRKLSLKQLEEIMHISPHLAEVNQQRFRDWKPPFTLDNALQAIFAYGGDIYNSMRVSELSLHELDYMQKRVSILSGLYGLLRPLDLIQPYRLSMNVRLENPKGINLYHFWHDILTNHLNQIETDTIIDLAFDNYFKVIDSDKLKAKVIKPVFLDEKAGKYMNVNAYDKEAMGLMTRFIVRNKLESSKMLHEFSDHGYQYCAKESNEHELVFKRSEKTAQQYQNRN